MHRHFLPTLTVLLLVLLTLAACGQGQKAAGPPAAAEPEVTVVTLAPKAVTLTSELPGRTSAHLVSEVRPQVGGIIQKRLFTEGGEVKAGEVLYQIVPDTYRAAYENAKAALAKAEANALPARLKGERFAGLTKVRAVSQQDNDDAQAAHKQAEAEVIAAKAALETTRINLSYTRVTAPISGRIGKSSVTSGALVTASQAAPLATIQQTDPIYVDVTQSSAEVQRLRRELQSGRLRKAADGGARASLLMEDGSPYPLEGVLRFADITVDQSTGEVTLRAEFPNPRRDLLPGLYVRAVLTEGVDEAALLVPQVAVSRDSKGNPQAMVVKPDNTVEIRPIVVSRVMGDTWLVESGLTAGERVIVDGLQKVRPGAKVKAVEAAPPAQAADAAPAEAQANATRADAPAPKAKPKAEPEVKILKKIENQAEPQAEPKTVKITGKKPAAKADGLPRPKKGEGQAYSPPKGEAPVPVPGQNGQPSQPSQADPGVQ